MFCCTHPSTVLQRFLSNVDAIMLQLLIYVECLRGLNSFCYYTVVVSILSQVAFATNYTSVEIPTT